MISEARKSKLRCVIAGLGFFLVGEVLAAPPASSSSLVPLPQQLADVPWPTRDWPTGDLPPSVSTAALEELLRVTAAPHDKLGETRAVVIIWRGRLVAERYMPLFSSSTPLVSWSVAKSVTHALTGIAVRKGWVDIDRPMGNSRWAGNDPRAAITWRQFLNMVDGQKYFEIGADFPTKNDAARMLFGPGRKDIAGFAASLPLVHTPGTHWNYNSAGINLISDALTNLVAPGADAAQRRARMAEFIAHELFHPLGMRTAQPEFDSRGTFMASALVYASARDFARFGLLYLRDGMWDGQRILPSGWVDFARTKNPATNSDIYGAGFWITPAQGRGAPFDATTPNAPKDMFRAEGHEGQLINIVPSKDLIVVRLGLVKDDQWAALGEWVEKLVALFPDLPH